MWISKGEQSYWDGKITETPVEKNISFNTSLFIVYKQNTASLNIDSLFLHNDVLALLAFV